jgi:sulfate transport system permease protein
MTAPIVTPIAPAPRAGRRFVSRSVLPGFGVAMGATLLFLGLVVLLPLVALALKTTDQGFARFIAVISSDRALAAFRVTIVSALEATAFNAVYGLLLAWVLARYRFPGRRLLDALVDLPFALPTAVAGNALTTLLAINGFFGRALAAIGVKVAYTPLGIVVAMIYTSLPFVVRTVQPVLEDIRPEIEEAAESLGATPRQTFARVLFPSILPAFIAGCSLAFARSLGEFGAVIFIAGNQPLKTEIAALLIYIRLEEFDYPAAAAIAAVLLVAALLVLLAVNALQAWQQRYNERG